MEKKKKNNVWLLIMGVLIILELAIVIFNAVKRVSGGSSINLRTIFKIISLAFIALYGFTLYKKPHGNILKYAMLLLATSEILSVSKMINHGSRSYYFYLVWLFVAVIIVYVAGRLNRIEQNKYLLGFAALAHLVGTLMLVIPRLGDASILNLFTWFSGEISIITLMIAYIVRYDEHKEAGISDK